MLRVFEEEKGVEMRGEHAAGKGDKNRLDGQEQKAYSNNKTLWDNLEQSRLKKQLDAAGQKIIEVKETWR